MLVIAFNMVTSFIGVECHFQQYVSYSVEHGDQFYWCLTTLSTMCQLQRTTWLPVLLVFNDTFNNVRYNVEHGDQFYWCLLPLSTMLVIA